MCRRFTCLFSPREIQTGAGPFATRYRVFGFTIVFIIMGAFMGVMGKLVCEYQTVLNIVTGAVVMLFGLNFMGVLKIGFLNRASQQDAT